MSPYWESAIREALREVMRERYRAALKESKKLKSIGREEDIDFDSLPEEMPEEIEVSTGLLGTLRLSY